MTLPVPESTPQPPPGQEVIINSVYKKVADFYKEYMLPYEPRAIDRTRRHFDYFSRDRPVKKRIDQVYRYRSGLKSQEYIYYNEQWEGTSHDGNKLNWGWTAGKVEVPYPRFVTDDSGVRYATEVEGHNTEYLIPFNETNLKEMEQEFHDGTKFIVTDGNILYGGPISEEMFRTWSFDDLIYFSQTGIKPGTQIVSPGNVAEQVRKQQAEDEKRAKR